MNFMDAIPGLKVLDEAGIKKLYFTAIEVLERLCLVHMTDKE